MDTSETSRVSEPGYFPRWHPYFRLAVREDVALPSPINCISRTCGR